MLVPAAWLLAQSGRLELVWWAFPISESVSLALSLLFFFRIRRQVLQPMYAAQPKAGA